MGSGEAKGPLGAPTAKADNAGNTNDAEWPEEDLGDVCISAPAGKETEDNEDLKQFEFDERIFERLEVLLQTPEFLKRLQEGHKQRENHPAHADDPHDDASMSEDSEDSFVMVSKDDAMEGLIYTIALAVIACPEAQDINPSELQAAIVKAFQELKNSKARSAWGWCKFVYRVSSWSYAAFTMYTNPWLVRALIAALWSIPRLFSRFFV